MTFLAGLPTSPTLAYGLRSGAWDRRRRPPVAVVWHTTGVGPVTRHRKNPSRWPDPFAAAVWLYTRAMRAGPHIVICGETGRTLQVAPVEAVAWHVGRRKGWRYARSGDRWERHPAFAWWRSRWHPRGIHNPRELAGGALWRGGECNPNTIGVEISPRRDDPRGRWSPETYIAIRRVAEAAQNQLGIPRKQDHQIGHSDAHPLARTRNGRGWDPHPEQFHWSDTLPK